MPLCIRYGSACLHALAQPHKLDNAIALLNAETSPTVQVVDNRGLAVRILQYNRSAAGEAAELRITRQRYTDSGQLLSSLDPRLAEAQQLDPAVAPNFRYNSSLSGRPLRSLSQDAGTRRRLTMSRADRCGKRGAVRSACAGPTTCCTGPARCTSNPQRASRSGSANGMLTPTAAAPRLPPIAADGWSRTMTRRD